MEREWPLVGRQHELSLVAPQLGTTGGAAGVVVLSGAAGIGKTVLLRALADRAAGAGVRVLRATATRSAASIPFGALARVLLEVGAVERAAPTDRTGALDPDLWDVLGHALGAVSRAAAGGPMLLAVDDAHLLDDASATLVQHLAESRELAVLLTVRSGEERPDSIEAVVAAPGSLHVALQDLGASDVAELAAAALGGPVARSTVDALRSASAGNPMLLRGLLLDALDAGAFVQEHGGWSWRGGAGRASRLQDVVAQHLRGLTDGDRSLLSLLAVGEPLPADAVQAHLATGAAGLAELERAGLVRVDVLAAGVAEVRLGNPLYGEVLRATLAATELQRLAGLAAGVLLGSGPLSRADRLRAAILQLDAGQADDVELLFAAAQDAVVLRAPDLLVRLARAAIAAGIGAPASLLLGEALLLLGHHDEAEATLGPLLPLLEHDRDRTHLGALLLQAVGWGDADDLEVDAALEGVEAAIVDPVWRQVLDGHRMQRLAALGRLDEVPDLGVALLDPAADARVRIRALASAGFALGIAGELDRLVALTDELLPAALGCLDDLPRAASWVVTSRGTALTLAGRVTEVEEMIAAVRAGVRPGERPAATLGVFEGRVALLTGDLARASDALRAARAALVRFDPYDNLRWCTALLAETLALLGAVDEAEVLVGGLAGLPQPSSTANDRAEIERAAAWVVALGGQVSVGEDRLRAEAAGARERGHHAVEVWLLHDGLRLGDRRSVDRLVEVAQRVDGIAPVLGRHARALVDGDAKALAEVSEAFEASGLRLLAAEAAAEAAAAFRTTAMSAAATAATRRAAALAAACGNPRTPVLVGSAAPATLTRRELESATLAARGLTNQEIAERLVVSVRTVEGHLYQAYTKLGVASRSELAATIGR